MIGGCVGCRIRIEEDWVVADFVPKDELGRIEWLKHFAGWMSAHGAGYGFSAADIADLNADVGAADTAFEDCDAAKAAARASVQAKKKRMADALRRARGNVKQLQANPVMTDAVRAEAHITVPDTIPTRVSPDAVQELDPPEVVLNWSKRQRVTIHYGLNPHNERQNALPAGIFCVQIQYHRGGLPEHEEDWLILDTHTDSPYVHVIHEDAPTTYAYRACWVDKKHNKGPYGDPAVCTVSV